VSEDEFGVAPRRDEVKDDARTGVVDGSIRSPRLVFLDLNLGSAITSRNFAWTTGSMADGGNSGQGFSRCPVEKRTCDQAARSTVITATTPSDRTGSTSLFPRNPYLIASTT